LDWFQLIDFHKNLQKKIQRQQVEGKPRLNQYQSEWELLADLTLFKN